MQLTPRYLVNNKTTIIANDAGFITEYRPVYSRHLQVYKGIDNTLLFKVLNHDQKPVDITSLTPKFVAFDQNKSLVIEHDATVLDDGSTTTRGNCKVVITENDLLNLPHQFLSYNIYLVDANNDKTLTYANSNFGAAGVIQVSDNTFPGPSATISVNTFVQDNNSWYSSTINAQPGINGNDALHTAVFYVDGYVGDITIQSTLENEITGTTKWATVKSVTLTGTETQPVAENYYGVFQHTRFVASSNPANKISKILVRN